MKVTDITTIIIAASVVFHVAASVADCFTALLHIIQRRLSSNEDTTQDLEEPELQGMDEQGLQMMEDYAEMAQTEEVVV